MRRRRKKRISSVVGSTDHGTKLHVPNMFVVEESSRTREVKREEEGSRIRRERDLFHVFFMPRVQGSRGGFSLLVLPAMSCIFW